METNATPLPETVLLDGELYGVSRERVEPAIRLRPITPFKAFSLTWGTSAFRNALQTGEIKPADKCALCQSYKPAGESCICFDNHCE